MTIGKASKPCTLTSCSHILFKHLSSDCYPKNNTSSLSVPPKPLELNNILAGKLRFHRLSHQPMSSISHTKTSFFPRGEHSVFIFRRRIDLRICPVRECRISTEDESQEGGDRGALFYRTGECTYQPTPPI